MSDEIEEYVEPNLLQRINDYESSTNDLLIIMIVINLLSFIAIIVNLTK